MNYKTISILGATGSIGHSTLDLIRRNPDMFKVTALTAHSSVKKLVALAKEFMPDFVAISDPSCFTALKDGLNGTGIKCGAGESALVDAAEIPSDMVMAAIVGAAGLMPTLAAARRGATIALANKECLVCAGDLMMEEVHKHHARILPVDSEHNAIFQVLETHAEKAIRRIVLTASGGPFLGLCQSRFNAITPAEAVAHPNWDMGAKISVDSATMMNKGLEVIEAFHLFPIEATQIDVLVHPQSVIHSMVDYVDGSTLAQLGSPDMRIPIASCLAWPERMPTPATPLDLAQIGTLTFEQPDYEKFRCLKLARDALLTGGAAPAVLNAANEVAVEAFLKENINFDAIPAVVEQTLAKSDMKAPQSLANVFEIDQEARRTAQALIVSMNDME
ncbi:1-deoxy-D-xylulose-5-phosphate reductoisomerase [Kordiimonas pumila]|uniref:1-deoxy-D-xylulose 5-phosphate reductoisomerase n=1 Tax=Kordiimonas pumila TaxID=2161677 RepID=A0ABV7D2M8_9PROT|nr:1-deoxy-D-xylulose-5-phosphate reductoisomerase [Kordiimonas pumila]